MSGSVQPVLRFSCLRLWKFNLRTTFVLKCTFGIPDLIPAVGVHELLKEKIDGLLAGNRLVNSGSATPGKIAYQLN